MVKVEVAKAASNAAEASLTLALTRPFSRRYLKSFNKSLEEDCAFSTATSIDSLVVFVGCKLKI